MHRVSTWALAGGAPAAWVALTLAARPLVAVLILLAATRAAPPLVALVLACAAAVFCAPSMPASALAAVDAAPLVALSLEVLRGAALGVAAATPLWAAATAGRWVGLGFGDGPLAGAPSRAIYVALAGVAFVAIDGPALLCVALARDYQRVGLGAAWLAPGEPLLSALVQWGEAAVYLSVPALLALACVRLALAAAERAGGAVAAALPRAAAAPVVAQLVVLALGPALASALVELWHRGLGA